MRDTRTDADSHRIVKVTLAFIFMEWLTVIAGVIAVVVILVVAIGDKWPN